MSHLVTVTTEVRDPIAVTSACARLKIPAPVHRKVRLFSSEATGLAVELSGWRYPVVCQTDSGELKYDNFGGRWGDQTAFDRFLQSYAVEKAKLEARRQGHCVTEQQLTDGSIRVQIAVAG